MVKSEVNTKKKNYDKEQKNIEDGEEIKFYSLTPTSVNENSIYIKALDYAIKEKSIFNIAITGKYGAGKTSTIMTYENFHKENSYLNISLASFKNNRQDDSNLIERSILQQIIYKLDSSKIPNSRFKRIKNVKNSDVKKIILNCFIILVTIIISVYFIINHNFINWESFKENIIQIYSEFFSTYAKGVIIFVCVFLLLCCIYNIFYKITKYIMVNIELSNIKLKNKDIEIEVNKNDREKDSIFNKYLDEIIYFFERTKYNVVVFEDLDRFQSSDEVFIKLRELNSIINKYENIDKKVKFIYAVKDETFEEKERTKFFDFIIPIIPVINAFNSKQKLVDKLDENNIRGIISDDYIRDITLYIDDMRILNNIINEFNIYRKNLPIKNLIMEKLFSIIVLKNINSKEFAELQEKKGILYNIFETKQERIEQYKKRLENKRNKLAKEKEDIEFAKEYSLKNIKSLLWLQIRTALERDYDDKIIINDENIDLKEFIKRLNKIEDIKEYKFGKAYYGRETQKLSFDEIIENVPEEDRINIDEVALKSEKKYVERERKLERLITNIENILNEIDRLQNMKLSYLLSKFGIENMLQESERQNDLIIFLLNHGYVDENYDEYINYFYPGELKNSDKEFIISLKSQRPLEYNYELKQISEIMKNLSNEYFSQKEILNFYLLDFLLKNDEYSEQMDLIFQYITSNIENTIDFCTSFIQKTNNVEKFMQKLCNSWKECWKFISENETENVKKIYLYNILKYVANSVIEDMDDLESFSKCIATDLDFIKNFEDNELEKIEEIITKLNVEFEKIDKNNIDKKLGIFIFANNYYKINKQIIYSILEKIYKYKRNDIKDKNYTCIIKTENVKFIQYIHENFSEYINNVYLLGNEQLYDNLNDIIEIINSEKITKENKNKIIERQIEKIDDISRINKQYFDNILKNNKMLATWNNVVTYYNEFGMTKNLSEFINNNFIKLNDKKIDNGTQIPFEILKKIICILEKNEGIDLILNQYKNLSEDEIVELLELFGIPYSSIRTKKVVKLENNNINTQIIDMLKMKKISFISSINLKNGYYIINRKRKI